ncbi:MAG: SoxR reducing system RseC family protein [Gammaproteobacteria bacterium]|jgi:sigma-E factor negative regulatory protein RseC|nr:SoxR reducing system RseC family protein [Gammaproteobacteria bacterium]MBU2181119.1 SoxR reducing system RseC family protein [Gammaproteobacteria bacterium]MBU2225533.1 SoxR reducing system RseC family protein [Gammaproteobacteria bacterium]MBU2280470.1 SoxR reducing system RseC family protein [Gammaproteobacteria bacterium]MBU2426957.1 SoxR reducing system RseC family protein [Gammaproteobacteria bacterium]
MVEEIATVVQVEAAGVWLQTKVVSSCQACSANDSCTSGVVAKAMTRRDYRFFLPQTTSESELLVGQQVRIGIHEDVLVKSALLVYLLPLLSFISALALAFSAGWSEGGQLLLAIGGGVGGMLLSRKLSLNLGSVQQQVQLLAVLPNLTVQNY